MKTQILLTTAGLLLLGSCTTTRFAAGEFDGIYYIPRQANVRLSPQTEQPERRMAQQTDQMPAPGAYQDVQEYYEYSDEETLQQETYQYADENYYDERRYFDADIRHDFSFAARIRRFHRPMHRWSYFDPWFTNMFWYTHNPHYFGVSIYHGFGSLGFHFPAFMHLYPSFYWDAWHSPFHWHSPWHFSPSRWGWWSWNMHWSPHWWHLGSWNRWNHGFWSGFHAGFHRGWWSNPMNFQYIYNSRDRSNYLYGHRRPVGTIIGGGDNQRQERDRSFAERFENRRQNNPPATPGAATAPATGVSERGRTMQPGAGASGGNISTGRAGGSVATDPQRPTGGAGTTREIRDRGAEGSRVEPREQMGGRGQEVRDPQGGRTVRETPNQGTNRAPADRVIERPTREVQPDRPQRQPESRNPDQPTMRQPESRMPVERVPSDRVVSPQRNPNESPTRSPQERQERTGQPQGEVNQPGAQRPRTYTPPSYQQPRSTQEYRSPQTTRPASPQRTETQSPPRQVEQPRERPQPQNIQRPQQPRSQPSVSQPPRQQEQPRSTPPPRAEPAPSRQPSGGSMSPQQSSPSGSGSGRSSEGGRRL